MRKSVSRDREQAKITKLAREYKNRGYKVFAELAGYNSPGIVSGVRPDLVAKKGDETIIIEVETKDTTKSSKDKIEKLARYAEEVPGARFDFVMTNPRPTPERFKRLRGSIAKELGRAHSYYQIWKQLWPTEEIVKILNEYKVFFQYTRASHLQLFLLAIQKITQRSRSSANIWRMLNEIEEYPNLTPQLSKLEIRRLREQLESHKNLLSRVRVYCNKDIVNIDFREQLPDVNIKQDKVITIKEAETLLEDLESIFNKISNAHDGNSWLFKMVGIEDTTYLLEALSRYRANRTNDY